MDGSSSTTIGNKFSQRKADCNSNDIGISDSQTSDLVCGPECESLTNHNTTQKKIKTSVSFSPTQGLTGVKQKDLSYDDLSRNIDANLAEIDMETFRSEDINSILALPAIYSGNYESVNNGEQCASVSGSLLNGLEIEASVSNRNSEDEISICKDEPLFSPQREPPVHERAISVDSLDSSSSYDQDLVLTCKANKNNYTIVFEGSETQFSEDSEYHSGGRSSEGESSRSEVFRINQTSAYTSNSMIQSDLVLTTWSNLKKSHISRRKSRFAEISIKSQSLPNLFCPSALVYDRKLGHLAKLKRIKNLHFFDFENSHPGNAQIRQCCYPYTLSLVKLFMKYKVSSRSSICSSEHSSSSSSLISHSLNNVNNLHTSSPKNAAKIREEKCNELTNRNYNIKNISCENINSSSKRQLFVDNAKVIEWRSPNCRETNINEKLNAESSEINCNNRHVPCNNNNQNTAKETSITCISNAATTPSGGECDNSQYFEDSLIEAPVLQTKNFHATPIKEEEETDISSGDDELMKTSVGSDNNCDSAADDVMIIQNNAVDVVSNTVKPENDHNLERINNIFPTSKSNIQPTTAPETERMNLNKTGQFVQNQLQETPTKQCNGNFSANAEASPMRSVSSSARHSGRQVTGIEHMLIRHSSSREASPNSSGYVSSRHSSLERLQRSVSSNADSPSRSLPSSRSSNIQLTKSRSCSTQIPVHVKDCCMQTSVNGSPTSNIKYVFVNSSGDIISKHSSNEDISARQMDKPDCKPKMLSKFSSTMHESLSKDEKCIYVCFPNYSLPDLSFLNSVMSDSSGSVFLSPTKFNPPQEMIRTLPGDSPDGIEDGCRRRLLNIKDLDSLKVLLPDNLKHLLTCIESERNAPVAEGSEVVAEAHDSVKLDLLKTKEPAKIVDAIKANISTTNKQSPSGILRKCSVVQSKKNDVPPVSTCCQMHKAFPVPKSPSHVNIQTCRPCSCQHSPPPVSLDHSYLNNASHGLHIPIRDQSNGGNTCPSCIVCPTEIKCKDASGKNFPLTSKDTGLCRNGAMPVRPKTNLGNFPNEFCLDGATCFQTKSCRQPVPCPTTQHECEDFDGSYRCENNLCCSSRKSLSGRVGENFHHCQDGTKEEKISNLPFRETSAKVQESPNSFQGCGELIDSDGAPQEFLVSPAQTSPCCAAPPDLYMLQSSITEDSNVFHSSLRKKTGLVENLQKATAAIYDDYSKNNCNGSCCTSFSVGQKILTSLCPAVHTILSDGLLPSVQGFFGPLPNSPWKVAEASIQLENSKKGVQEMLEHVNSEKLLTDSTYRFNAFIIGLLNLGCLEWWLGHLLSSRSLISHHYHPTALLSLLSLPASAHLQQELKELVSPLTSLTFSLDLAFETRMAASKGSNQGKCANSCCSSDGKQCEDVANMNHVPHFTFCFSNKEQKQNKAGSVKHAKEVVNASKKSSKSDKEDIPWPGITINPFPNVQTAEEVSKKFFPKTGEQKLASPSNHHRTEHGQLAKTSQKSKARDRRMIVEALCSSTDSGCSSQAAQSHEISLAATDSGESESHSSGKQDPQQFRKLQQKWEKLAHGVATNGRKTTVEQAQQPVVKKVEKVQVRSNVRDIAAQSHIKKGGAISKATSTRLGTRDQSEMQEKRHHHHHQQQPDTSVTPRHNIQKPEKEKRSKSQIPLLRAAKNNPPKSRIPIQKSGGRAHSTNRENLRNC